MRGSVVALAVTAVLTSPAASQSPGSNGRPVIDMHVHSGNSTPQQALERMQTFDLRYLWVGALANDLAGWAGAIEPERYLPSIVFPCPGGRALFSERSCWSADHDLPDIEWLRGEVEAGRVKALGEITPQMVGLPLTDERLEPYWALAEAFDLPVAVHMGPGPPAAAYEASPSPVKYPEFRMAAADPIVLEEVLLRHKKLRMLVMHAGWPFLDSMLALLYAHPNVYVDVGALQAEFMVPRPSYYRHLRSLVEAGFGKRIVFGSDFPQQLRPGIDAIMAADFLTDEQKSDILCANAARFLSLDEAICSPQ